MTSGTPESIQNCVLSGFQNCFDFASMSCLEAKEISSSVTATSVTVNRCRTIWIVRLNQRSIAPTVLLSSGRVSLRLTQPELLIMVPTGCYAPRKCAGGVPVGHPQVPESPSVAATAQPAEDYDVSQRQDVAKLRKGAIGLGGVLFLTVTGSAPISAMLFNTPIVVGFGQGVGAPAAFMFATIVLVVFSVGYVAMARKKTTAGGFYSYISHGLGRELGIGTGYASVVAYSVFEASLAGGFAYFLSLKLNQFGLISEVVILLIFDVFLLARGHVTAAPLNPVNAFKGFPAEGKLAAGAIGIGLFFAFWSWVGFEMAPNYGEESRDPKRIVPRALYISVIGLGVFYTITSWASLAGYPTTKAAIAQSQSNAAQYFLAPASQYAGHWVSSVMSYLIITGSFACGMAFHNTTARYLYSVGREGLAPRALGRTHPKWKSPHIASITQSVVAAIIIGLFAIFTGSNDPNSQAYIQLYGLMAVMGVIIILSVQALVSLSIFVYFERHPDRSGHWWKTRLAPAVSFLSQAYVVYLLFDNIKFLGSGYSYANWLGPIDLVVVAGGIIFAFYLKSRNRAQYESAGRLINEGL